MSSDEGKGGDPMSLAFAEARSAELRGETPIGAALIRDGTVIASAGNRTRELADPTAHAEMLVIREAAARLGSERLAGCDLYVTLEPCAMCAGAISHRPPAPPLLRRPGPQGRRGRQRPALLPGANLPPRARGLRGVARERGGGDAARRSSQRGDKHNGRGLDGCENSVARQSCGVSDRARLEG